MSLRLLDHRSENVTGLVLVLSAQVGVLASDLVGDSDLGPGLSGVWCASPRDDQSHVCRSAAQLSWEPSLIDCDWILILLYFTG